MKPLFALTATAFALAAAACTVPAEAGSKHCPLFCGGNSPPIVADEGVAEKIKLQTLTTTCSNGRKTTATFTDKSSYQAAVLAGKKFCDSQGAPVSDRVPKHPMWDCTSGYCQL